MRPPVILALDTSAAHCAAAVFADGALCHSTREEMAKGQAERILTLASESLAAAGLGLDDLTALAVGVGPGNFTGIRISVSAVRGLALALEIPAIAVSTFEALRGLPDADAPADDPGHELVAIAAPRGAAYVQRFAHGLPAGPALMIDPAAPPAHLSVPGLRVIGADAEPLAAALGATAHPRHLQDPAGQIARIAAWKLAQGTAHGAPAPLYIRAADAAPARDAPPRIIA